MPTQTFGEALRRLRRGMGRSLADLADALGCSIAFMSEVERGRKNPPSASGIKKILASMGQECRLSEFLLLAARSRRSIEIELEDKSDEVTSMLLALQRRCDEGELDADIVEEIRRLRRRLEKGNT
jgi:transcriptional regulator with XRE-family HTH domain